MPRSHPSPLSGKGGTTRNRSIMVPLALVMVRMIAGVLMMPIDGARHLPTDPCSIQVCKAALLFAQVKSHAAATLLPGNTNLCLLHHFVFCVFLFLFCRFTGTVIKHKTRSCLMYELLTLAKSVMNEPTGWLAAVAAQACVCDCVCVSGLLEWENNK